MSHLQAIVCGVLSFLPALDNEFACLDGLNIQERRWRMEQLNPQQILFGTLAQRLESDKKSQPFLKLGREVMAQDSLTA